MHYSPSLISDIGSLGHIISYAWVLANSQTEITSSQWLLKFQCQHFIVSLCFSIIDDLIVVWTWLIFSISAFGLQADVTVDVFPSVSCSWMTINRFKSHSIAFDGFERFELSSVVWKVQHSHSRHQKITSNLLRFRITLKGRERDWGSPMNGSLEGATCTCIHKHMTKFLGASWKCLSFANFSKYWWFQTKQLTKTGF